jgi:hypothetical protein
MENLQASLWILLLCDFHLSTPEETACPSQHKFIYSNSVRWAVLAYYEYKEFGLDPLAKLMRIRIWVYRTTLCRI